MEVSKQRGVVSRRCDRGKGGSVGRFVSVLGEQGYTRKV